MCLVSEGWFLPARPLGRLEQSTIKAPGDVTLSRSPVMIQVAGGQMIGGGSKPTSRSFF